MVAQAMIAVVFFLIGYGARDLWLWNYHKPEPQRHIHHPGFDNYGYLPDPLPEWIAELDDRLERL